MLSPAAYLVDLLHFLDVTRCRQRFRSTWRSGHHDVPYPYPFATIGDWFAAGIPRRSSCPRSTSCSPAGSPVPPAECENTNTALPALDLVNETLEHFVAHDLRLDGYRGHTTPADVSPPELAANPQFTLDAAYDVLTGADPDIPIPPIAPLPFDLPLERLRRLFAGFGGSDTTLARCHAPCSRADESLERADDEGYGWRDVWMEQLGLSRAEHRLLVDHTVPLATRVRAFSPMTPETDVVATLSNAKTLCRRVAISYEELVGILRTRFVNPHGDLLGKLEGLGVPIGTIKAFHDGLLSDEQFTAALSPHVDPVPYGGDVLAWATR